MLAIRRPRHRMAALAMTLVGCGCAGWPALAQRVGVNSAVNPDATGIPPGGVSRHLVLGQDVLFDERIATAAAGQTQILFVDASTLTVGPNSNMVIDQFVYNPRTSTGKLAASLTRGVFRFVGGALSKGENAVTFHTPTATIGIRGGVMLVDVNPDCSGGQAAPETAGCNALQVIFAYGKGVTVTGLDGVSQTITRPGFQVTVARAGASPSAPAPASQAAISGFLAQLDGRSGAHGGAQTIPTDVIVEQSTAAVIASTAAPTFGTFTQTQPPAPAATLAALSLNTQLAQSSGATQTASSMPPIPPTPPAPPTPPIIFAGGYADTDGQGTELGFAGNLSGYANGRLASGMFTATGAFGTLVFPLGAGSATSSASGVGTSSPLGPVTGTTFLSPGDSFFYADLTPVADPAQREFIFGGTPVNPTFFETPASGPRVIAFNLVPDAFLQSGIPFIRQGTGGLLGGASVSPLMFGTPSGSVFSTGGAFTKALQASLAIDGAGVNQKSVIVVLVGNVFTAALNGSGTAQPILNGVIHGSYLGNAFGQPIRIFSSYVTPADGNGNSFYGANGITGLVLSNGSCCNGEIPPAFETNSATGAVTNYQFVQPAVATAAPAIANGPRTRQTFSGWFGGIMTKEPNGGAGKPISYVLSGGAKIATDPSNFQAAAELSGTDPFSAGNSGIRSIDLNFGSLNGSTDGRIAYINNNLFAVLENSNNLSKVNGVPVPVNFSNTGANTYLVTATAAPPTSLLPNGLCTCQYLQWGYWGGELDTPAGNGNPARVDVGHINSWVAGSPTHNIAGLGGAVGRYRGNLFGTVDNAGAKYLASGGLVATYNFGTQAGSFSVSNYDGHTFTLRGQTSISGTASYSFGFNSDGLLGRINGSFYGPGAVETGGNFAFHTTAGASYFTSGIFGARMIGH